MHKTFEINWTKIKGGCQLGRKVVTHNSKSDLPLAVGLCLAIRTTCIVRACLGEKEIQTDKQTYNAVTDSA